MGKTSAGGGNAGMPLPLHETLFNNANDASFSMFKHVRLGSELLAPEN